MQPNVHPVNECSPQRQTQGVCDFLGVLTKAYIIFITHEYVQHSYLPTIILLAEKGWMDG